MYSIIFSDSALKQLKKLEKDTQKRIISTLERSKIRPHAYVKKLVGSKYFRLRSGDYRIIIDIQKEELRIFVIKVSHRKKIYKN